MADEQFKEWMHYKQPNIPDLQDAFSAGRTAGIAWAEPFTAKRVLEFIADSRYELPDFLIDEVKAKFGIVE